MTTNESGSPIAEGNTPGRPAEATRHRSPAGHYVRAEECLNRAEKAPNGSDDRDQWLRLAQVHATLATVLDGTASRAETLADRAETLRQHDNPA